MKNHLMALAVLFLSGTAAFGATENASSVQTDLPRKSSSEERMVRRIIPEASLIMTQYQGGQTNGYNPRNGYAVGAVLDIIGTGPLVFETGAFYKELAADYNGLNVGNNQFTANYLTIPFTAKYYFRGQENTSLYLKAGIQGSTLLSSNTTYASRFAGSTVNFNARSWDVGYLVGVGEKFYLAPSTDFLLEANYTRALNSLFNNADIYTADLGITLGLGFNL